ncbi:MAG: hypothetical protein A3E01_18475 [Gammaproteobacteria bacterium RIFCSPHIGHO2_12_FULL_63_22]|nr:MAG: hypothetical protein A3E01_18475 [Gammaproteobacteria bacterium RIFCSPHIGHO2_12_FULL_63_22]
MSAVIVVVALVLGGVLTFATPGAPLSDPSTWHVLVRDFGPVCIYTWGPAVHSISKREVGLEDTATCPGLVKEPFRGTLNGGGNQIEQSLGAPAR